MAKCPAHRVIVQRCADCGPTCPVVYADLQNFCDPWTDSRSFVEENLLMLIDVDAVP